MAMSKPPSSKKKNWKDHKPTPKVLSDQERLNRLFPTLCAQIDGGHFSNAVKTCDKILRLAPKDSDARRTKLFLLLQTEQYNKALGLIEEYEDPNHHAYERAYSLYRLQRESDARVILESIRQEKGEDDRGLIHLEAQLNYREGNYQAAFDLYNQLLDTANENSEEYFDISTNLKASQKHAEFINRGFLQNLDALPASITSTLETAPPPVHPLSAAAALATASTLANAGAQQLGATKTETKKIRASRLPAGVIPGLTPPPDPERWLKKSERSTYGQGRRRKGPGGGGGATQGSANVDNQPSQTSAGHSVKSSGGKGKKKK